MLIYPWDSPGKNTGVGCHFRLQGIFPTQGTNLNLLGLLHWQAGSSPLSHTGSPVQFLINIYGHSCSSGTGLVTETQGCKDDNCTTFMELSLVEEIRNYRSLS